MSVELRLIVYNDSLQWTHFHFKPSHFIPLLYVCMFSVICMLTVLPIVLPLEFINYNVILMHYHLGKKMLLNVKF